MKLKDAAITFVGMCVLGCVLSMVGDLCVGDLFAADNNLLSNRQNDLLGCNLPAGRPQLQVDAWLVPTAANPATCRDGICPQPAAKPAPAAQPRTVLVGTTILTTTCTSGQCATSSTRAPVRWRLFGRWRR